MSEQLHSCPEHSSKKNSISEDEILSRIQGFSQLPKFADMQSFEVSDFFRDNYFISLDHISYDSTTHFESLHFLKSPEYYNSVKAIQRILIFLGYLQESDLSGKTLYDESEQPVSYFGIFGPKTQSAVKEFQKRNCLLGDGEVGEDTKISLYRSIFHRFHRFHQAEPSSVFISKLAELRLGIE